MRCSDPVHRSRKKYILSSRAKRGICFSSRIARNSRFLGQTPPFGMTWREFLRSLFKRALVIRENARLKADATSACEMRSAPPFYSRTCTGRVAKYFRKVIHRFTRIPQGAFILFALDFSLSTTLGPGSAPRRAVPGFGSIWSPIRKNDYLLGQGILNPSGG